MAGGTEVNTMAHTACGVQHAQRGIGAWQRGMAAAVHGRRTMAPEAPEVPDFGDDRDHRSTTTTRDGALDPRVNVGERLAAAGYVRPSP